MSFLDFVDHGLIGLLRPGLSKAEVVASLGNPELWVGKPPCFGAQIPDFHDSMTWIYYEAASISFDDDNVANSVNVIFSRLHEGLAVFRDWPVGCGSKLQELEVYLRKHQVPYVEDPEEAPGSYYLLARGKCIALFAGYQAGRLLPKREWEITMMSTYSHPRHLPPFVWRVHRGLV